MCTERPESFGQRLSQEFDKSGQEGVRGHCCAGEKQWGLFFVALFPVALSARGAVAMAFVTSSWLAFPELGGASSPHTTSSPLLSLPHICQRDTVQIFILQGRRGNKAWVLQLIA